MTLTPRHNPPTHTVPSRPAPTPRPGPADALTTPPADAAAQAGQTAPAHRPTWQAVLPDLLAFALGLGLAYVFRWQTADLVWSLWLGSLVIGYLTILATLGSAGLVWLRLLRHPEAAPPGRRPILLGGLLAGLFMLVFFSVHFCGFHAGHSVFLNQFFPLEGLPKDAFGRAFMNPPLLWLMVLRHLVRPYGLFLIPAILTERQGILGPLRQAWQALANAPPPPLPTAASATTARKPRQPGLDHAMVRPYTNVVRMHLLIFFFAFCHFLKLDSFLVYAVVYAVYFFPWRTMMALRPANRRRAAQALT